MTLVKVTAHSRVAEVQAIDASAVNQMVKAIVTARRFLDAEGVVTTCEPSLVDLSIDGAERTAVRFSIAVVGRT